MKQQRQKGDEDDSYTGVRGAQVRPIKGGAGNETQVKNKKGRRTKDADNRINTFQNKTGNTQRLSITSVKKKPTTTKDKLEPHKLGNVQREIVIEINSNNYDRYCPFQHIQNM